MSTEVTEPQKEELIKRVEIEGTPFTAILVEEKWFLAAGKYRLTEPLKSLEECKKESKPTWPRIMQMIYIVNENTKLIEQVNRNQNEN